MNDQRWRRIEEVFHIAADLAPDDRTKYLLRVCIGDDELRRQVELLLANDKSRDDVLEAAVARAVDQWSESADSASPGTRLGPYEIVTLIGKGGMGEVYRARDIRLDRTVAIKILNAAHGDRFQREARTIAALNHPNICHLYDVGPNYLVMEFIEGTQATGPLPLDRWLSIAWQIIDAVVAAHAKGIVHRDLKPANIMITRENVVKVLDFGLSKFITKQEGGPSATATLTQPGLVMGTPGYMSPEQVRGGDIDERSDIWSFGCVLFELVSGHRSFGGDSFAEQIAAVLTREPDWSLLPAETPRGLQAILRRCLDKDPTRRYQSMEQMRLQLEQSVRGRDSGFGASPWAGATPGFGSSRRSGSRADRGSGFCAHHSPSNAASLPAQADYFRG